MFGEASGTPQRNTAGSPKATVMSAGRVRKLGAAGFGAEIVVVVVVF